MNEWEHLRSDWSEASLPPRAEVRQDSDVQYDISTAQLAGGDLDTMDLVTSRRPSVDLSPRAQNNRGSDSTLCGDVDDPSGRWSKLSEIVDSTDYEWMDGLKLEEATIRMRNGSGRKRFR